MYCWNQDAEIEGDVELGQENPKMEEEDVNGEVGDLLSPQHSYAETPNDQRTLNTDQNGMHAVGVIPQDRLTIVVDQTTASDSQAASQLEQYNALAEHQKAILKFAYWIIGLAFAGIVSIFSGVVGNQVSDYHKILLMVCISLMVSTMLCGVGLMVLGFITLVNQIWIPILNGIQYTAIGLITLSVISVFIIFL